MYAIRSYYEIAYEKAIRLSPNFLDPKLNIIALYFNSGNIDRAFSILKTISVEETSARYQKTFRVVLGKIINNESLKDNLTTTDVLFLNKCFSDAVFFKELVKTIIERDLAPNEIIDHILKFNNNSKPI